MRRGLTWLMPILLLAACEPGVNRATYLSQFIGSSETNLISALGVPTRSIESGGIQFLAYRDHRVDIIPGMPGFPAYGSPFGPYRYGGVYGGIPPQVVERDCETTFELVDNKVRSFTLRGNAC